MINVGIVGCGFIGGALKQWLSENNKNVKLFISDPYKGYNDSLEACDVVFISIHIPTEVDGSQDLSVLNEIISKLPNCPIFIRTTLLPGTCDKLAKKYQKKIYFMPEFLTERTAYQDFSTQSMIFCGEEDLLKNVFVGKQYILMTSLEAEITKYVHNVFGALKVTYFNGVYDLCKHLNCNFDKVHEGVLLSGYINETHTLVPGPDGKMGYGGKCFPKDVNAFKKHIQEYPLAKLIEVTAELNSIFRKE